MTSSLVAGIGIHLEVGTLPGTSLRAHHHAQVVALIDKSLWNFHHEHVAHVVVRRTHLLPSVGAVEDFGHILSVDKTCARGARSSIGGILQPHAHRCVILIGGLVATPSELHNLLASSQTDLLGSVHSLTLAVIISQVKRTISIRAGGITSHDLGAHGLLVDGDLSHRSCHAIVFAEVKLDVQFILANSVGHETQSGLLLGASSNTLELGSSHCLAIEIKRSVESTIGFREQILQRSLGGIGLVHHAGGRETAAGDGSIVIHVNKFETKHLVQIHAIGSKSNVIVAGRDTTD